MLVSGNGKQLDGMWYQRIAAVLDGAGENPLASEVAWPGSSVSRILNPESVDPRLCNAWPVGTRKPVMSDAQRSGVWLHGLLQYLTAPDADLREDMEQELQRKLNIAPGQMPVLWQQAQEVLNTPELARFFDAKYYLAAANELAYVNATGQLRRIDRLVEFENEVWILDYKTGASADPQFFSVQLEEYRTAIEAIHPYKVVRCAVIFADGKLAEV